MDDVHLTVSGERRPDGRRSPRHLGRPPSRACAYTLALTLAALAAAPKAPSAPSPRDPGLLGRAEQIRADVDARYRLSGGRKLTVTEASSTAVVASLTLLSDRFGGARVVDTQNGIYFAICSGDATCPYPARSAAWPATASRPLRAAVELAVRAFSETQAGLVVVALPTRQPVWLVLERGDVVGGAHWPPLRGIASRNPAVEDASLGRRIERLARPHLFAPVGLVSVSTTEDSVVAAALTGPGRSRPSA